MKIGEAVKLIKDDLQYWLYRDISPRMQELLHADYCHLINDKETKK